MTTNELQELKDLIGLLNRGVSKEEFVSNFSQLLDFVKQLKKQNAEHVSLMQMESAQTREEILQGNAKEISAAKTDLLNTILKELSKALKEQENGMKFMYDKAASLRSIEGPPGPKGDRGDSIKGDPGSPDTGDEIIAKINDANEFISTAAIKGLDEWMQKNAVAPGPKEIRSGWGAHPVRISNSSGTAIDKVVRHIKFGTNLTTTRSADGTVTVNASAGGGGGFTTLAATETPNGSITVFTFADAAAQPSYLVVDNVWMQATSKAGTVNWTWNAVTLKATLTIAANDDIFAVV